MPVRTVTTSNGWFLTQDVIWLNNTSIDSTSHSPDLPETNAKWCSKDKSMQLKHDKEEWPKVIKNLNKEIPKHASIGCQIRKEQSMIPSAHECVLITHFDLHDTISGFHKVPWSNNETWSIQESCNAHSKYGYTQQCLIMELDINGCDQIKQLTLLFLDILLHMINKGGTIMAG